MTVVGETGGDRTAAAAAVTLETQRSKVILYCHITFEMGDATHVGQYIERTGKKNTGIQISLKFRLFRPLKTNTNPQFFFREICMLARTWLGLLLKVNINTALAAELIAL
jgi:hypothetical protein